MSVAKGIVAVAVAAAVAALAGLALARGGDSFREPRGSGGARAYAESLLDRVSLPKSARPFMGRLPSDLAAAPSRAAIGNQVDRHRVYRVTDPYPEALADIALRGLPGFWSGGRGLSGPPNGPPTLQYLTFSEKAPPPGIYRSDLDVSSISDGANASLLRLDAQVVWRPARTTAEHVPATDRVITLDRTTYTEQGRPPSKQHRLVTDAATVTRLIALFNGLPTMPPGTMSTSPANCLSSVTTISFALTTTASSDVTGAIDTGCLGRNLWTWAVAAGGKAQPGISDANGVLVGAITAALTN